MSDENSNNIHVLVEMACKRRFLLGKSGMKECMIFSIIYLLTKTLSFSSPKYSNSFTSSKSLWFVVVKWMYLP